LCAIARSICTHALCCTLQVACCSKLWPGLHSRLSSVIGRMVLITRIRILVLRTRVPVTRIRVLVARIRGLVLRIGYSLVMRIRGLTAVPAL
jgi:hypothetical protein